VRLITKHRIFGRIHTRIRQTFCASSANGEQKPQSGGNLDIGNKGVLNTYTNRCCTKLTKNNIICFDVESNDF